jgi:hypothetical protein
MEQMMARLLAEMKMDIRISQAEAGANLKEMKEEMTARLEAITQRSVRRRWKPTGNKCWPKCTPAKKIWMPR